MGPVSSDIQDVAFFDSESFLSFATVYVADFGFFVCSHFLNSLASLCERVFFFFFF